MALNVGVVVVVVLNVRVIEFVAVVIVCVAGIIELNVGAIVVIATEMLEIFIGGVTGANHTCCANQENEQQIYGGSHILRVNAEELCMTGAMLSKKVFWLITSSKGNHWPTVGLGCTIYTICLLLGGTQESRNNSVVC